MILILLLLLVLVSCKLWARKQKNGLYFFCPVKKKKMVLLVDNFHSKTSDLDEIPLFHLNKLAADC